MSTLEASRTFEPFPPRPLSLCPSPSARKVVGRCGTRAGSTTAAARATTPTSRPVVANAVVGSASGPAEERGAAVPQDRSDRTPCRPDEGEPAQGARHGVPGTEPVAGVRRRAEEGGQQGDPRECWTAVRHPDGVDGERRDPEDHADREDGAPGRRRGGGVVRHRLLRLAEQDPEGPAGLRRRQEVAPQVASAVHEARRVEKEQPLAEDDERAGGREPPQADATDGDDRDEQHRRARPGGLREQRRQGQGDGEGGKGGEEGLDGPGAVHRTPTS